MNQNEKGDISETAHLHQDFRLHGLVHARRRCGHKKRSFYSSMYKGVSLVTVTANFETEDHSER